MAKTKKKTMKKQTKQDKKSKPVKKAAAKPKAKAPAKKKKTAAKRKTAAAPKAKAKTSKKTKPKTAAQKPAAQPKKNGAAQVVPGMDAPTFSLPTDSGAIDLASFRGAKNVVLYFYPKDDTPGCTVQACTFEKDSTDYSAHDTVVVGVSADDAASHARFRTKYNLSFPLVVDEGAKLANRYGVWVEKNNYGRKYMGIQRATFLIDKQGRVAKVWPKVKVEGHSKEVLEALKSL